MFRVEMEREVRGGYHTLFQNKGRKKQRLPNGLLVQLAFNKRDGAFRSFIFFLLHALRYGLLNRHVVVHFRISKKACLESIFVRAGRDIMTFALTQGTPFIRVGNGSALGWDQVRIRRGKRRVGKGGSRGAARSLG